MLLVLAVGAAAGYVLYRKHQARNIRGSSSVEFVTTQAPTKKRTPLELRQVPWPMYGLDDARTRFADGVHFRPPFRRLWTAGGTSLLEFPPAVGYGRLFLSNNDYPQAAALSFVLMAAILTMVFAYARVVGSEELTSG